MSAHAPAVSAVMARICLLWRANTGAELGIHAETGMPQVSWWGAVSRIRQLPAHRPASPLHLPGSRRWPQTNHSWFVAVGTAAVGLRGPPPDGT